MLIIAMNMATMMLEYYGQDERMDDTLDILFIGDCNIRMVIRAVARALIGGGGVYSYIQVLPD